MKTDSTAESTKSAKTEDGSVLQIGLQYFWFDSHTDAAKAFALLSKATHVQKNYKPRRNGTDNEFVPKELIGDIGVTMAPRSLLKIPERSAS
jgi:hypothetical protein